MIYLFYHALLWAGVGYILLTLPRHQWVEHVYVEKAGSWN